MVATEYTYKPDYAIPPGWALEERLEAHDISQAEFARRCGRSPKLISEIISGKAPIEPRTAIQFESVLGVDAGIWLGMEKDYRLHKAREAENLRAIESLDWAKLFPINELVKRNIINKPESDADRVQKLLSFFGVASVEAWQIRQDSLTVAYRHSKSFKSDESALATWLRLGEIKAAQLDLGVYNESEFKRALSGIRRLTQEDFELALQEAQRLCGESGVALAIIKPISRTALSGATRWLTPRKALIQLSARHMSDDQLWFSFFHEAAHVLLHSKKEIFVHEGLGNSTEIDAEADRWAADFLAPPRDWESFRMSPRFDERNVRSFAERQGISAGVVVGRLQHESLIPWNSRLNRLKVRFEWDDDAI